MTPKLFEHLAHSRQDMYAGRVIGLELGIVTDTKDPLNLHRIKVTTGDKGGLTESYWVMRSLVAKGITAPVPALGDTVVIGYLDADPHNAVYLGTLANYVTQPEGTEYFKVVIGASTFEIAPDAITLRQGETSLVLTANGASINGQQIVTVGASVSQGNIITRGW